MTNKCTNPSINEVIRALNRTTKGTKQKTPRSTTSYIRLLKHIRSRDGALATELATLMAIKPSSLSQMIANLESDGYVSRTRDPQDKRKHRFSLTDHGHNHLNTIKHTKYEIFKGILTEEEENHFIKLAQKLIHGVSYKDKA